MLIHDGTKDLPLPVIVGDTVGKSTLQVDKRVSCEIELPNEKLYDSTNTRGRNSVEHL